MIAAPANLPALDSKGEQQRMEKALEPLKQRGLVQLTWLTGQTWQAVQQAMRQGPWHIFHFIGHGSFDSLADEGVIAFADEAGQAQLLRATQLGTLLADQRPLRLVVLNACQGAEGSRQDVFSSTASILVRSGLPAVLAMQYSITDTAALAFSRAFYEALADSLPVDAVVSEARKAVSLGGGDTL
jgi:CHAT domain-containing protein